MGIDLQGGRGVGGRQPLAGGDPTVRGGGKDRRPFRGAPVSHRPVSDGGRPLRQRPRERFELARDLDVLRFRADSRINAIIREVAAEQAAAGVRLVDAQRALAQSDPDSKGISGGDLFYEHVHLTFAGNYLLARAVFEQVCAALPQLAAVEKHGTIPSRQRCAELLALTPWDEYQLAAKMVDMTSRKPFTNQLNHGLRQAAVLRAKGRASQTGIDAAGHAGGLENLRSGTRQSARRLDLASATSARWRCGGPSRRGRRAPSHRGREDALGCPAAP